MSLDEGFTDEDALIQDSEDKQEIKKLQGDVARLQHKRYNVSKWLSKSERLLDEVINIIEAQPPVNNMPNVIRRAPLLEQIKQLRR